MATNSTKESLVVVVRGGGDLATGTIQKLSHAGFKVVVTETQRPLAIRRTVALCEAVISGRMRVEDIVAVKAENIEACFGAWERGEVPVLVDPTCQCVKELAPLAVVDAILAKKNLGLSNQMAPIVIALGPGFSAPEDADVIIETMRGHTLGKLIFKGPALPNTGVPGLLGGKTAERVVHAPVGGIVRHRFEIGAVVKRGEVIFYIDDEPVYSPLDGTLRGLIAEGMKIPKGLKCADVDPRPANEVDCYTISDKSRALGGAVIDALLLVGRQKNLLSFTKGKG